VESFIPATARLGTPRLQLGSRYEQEPTSTPGLAPGITRRDFLNGVAISVGAALLPPDPAAADVGPAPASGPFSKGYYPPALTGLRGSHLGSFEVAHALRDGKTWANPVTDGERYDLVIVGAGISGLAAAYFYRNRAGPQARILLLDNHDDFGGHAKRNEFRGGSPLLLGHGGTQSLENPGRYSPVAKQLLRDLGVDVTRFYRYYDQKLWKKRGLEVGLFFDKSTFGVDRLIVAPGIDLQDNWRPDHYLTPAVITQLPIDPQARRDLLRLVQQQIDYLPGLDPEQKRIRLTKTSYADYLLHDAKVHPDVVRMLQTFPHEAACVGIDAVSANECRGLSCPGFAGMEIAAGPSGEDYGEGEEPYIFHFPDGNASIARLLVRSLIPDSAPGSTMEDIVTARLDYSRLDLPGRLVRLRLNSTAVNVEHANGGNRGAVTVKYLRDGMPHSAIAGHCVLACWNTVIPYLCPTLPPAQKQALAYAVKQPLVYVNVQLRNSRALQARDVYVIWATGSYFTTVALDFPVSMGRYRYPANPDEPCLLRLVRTPCSPGLDCKSQFRAGRAELLTTPFSTFEREIRAQLTAVLGPSGFDADRDIQAITVNRWPHGYAYGYNELYEPLDQPPGERPCVQGRQPFGNITIANSDAAGRAYTDAAIDEAHRAVAELFNG